MIQIHEKRGALRAQRRWMRSHALVGGVVLLLAASTAVAASPAPAPGAGRSAVGVVNVNTASVEQLQALPGIGEARARAIVERRQSRGPFESVEQLSEIRGIGDAMVDRLRPHVTLEGKTTANGR